MTNAYNFDEVQHIEAFYLKVQKYPSIRRRLPQLFVLVLPEVVTLNFVAGSGCMSGRSGRRFRLLSSVM